MCHLVRSRRKKDEGRERERMKRRLLCAFFCESFSFWKFLLASFRPDPITFIALAVDTTGSLYDEFMRLLLLDAHRDASALANEFPEQSDLFRFLRASCFTNLNGVVGLIMTETSDMRISIPLDLSSQCLIPIPRFIRSRRPTPFLAPSIVLFHPRSA